MPISTTSGKRLQTRVCTGFTLVELMVAFAIGALVIAVSTPMAMRMYDTMQYRDAIRSLSSAATTARYRAITGGRAMDLVVEADANRYHLLRNASEYDPNQARSLDDDLNLAMTSARGLSPTPGVGVIRFYPNGSSSGGSITISRAGGDGVRLRIDWLLGRVTQQPPDAA